MWQIRHRETGRILLSGDGNRPSPYALANANLAGADLANLKCPFLDLRGANLAGACLNGVTAGHFAFDRRTRILAIGAWFVLIFFVQWIVPRLGEWQTMTVLAAAAVVTAYVIYREVDAFNQRQRFGLPPDVTNYEQMGEMAFVNLEKANLKGASLVGARLPRALMNRVNLTGARLCNAGLRNADLVNADLGGADLRGTDLSNACLVDADLSGAVYDEKTRRPADFMPERHGKMTRLSDSPIAR